MYVMRRQQLGKSFLGINEAQAAAARARGAPYWIIVMESYWRQRVRQRQQASSRAWRTDPLHCRSRDPSGFFHLFVIPKMEGCPMRILESEGKEGEREASPRSASGDS